MMPTSWFGLATPPSRPTNSPVVVQRAAATDLSSKARQRRQRRRQRLRQRWRQPVRLLLEHTVAVAVAAAVGEAEAARRCVALAADAAATADAAPLRGDAAPGPRRALPLPLRFVPPQRCPHQQHQQSQEWRWSRIGGVSGVPAAAAAAVRGGGCRTPTRGHFRGGGAWCCGARTRSSFPATPSPSTDAPPRPPTPLRTSTHPS